MVLTTHVQKRMQSRGISEEDIQEVVRYGRTFYARGAVFKVIGKKEIERYSDNAELDHLEGVHVVIAHDGAVITTYRNRQFHRGEFCKPRYRRHRNPAIGETWFETYQHAGSNGHALASRP